MADQKEHFDLEPHGDDPEAPLPPPPSPSSPPPPSSSSPPRQTGFGPPRVTPVSPADAPPLLELAEDKCPRCGTVLKPDAVFCIKCGYDMRSNEVRTPTVGVEEVVEKPKEESREFSPPGRGDVKLLLGIGGAVTLGAMVVAGLNAPQGLPVVAAVIFCLYEVALHTGTGLVAVLVAARIAELKPGRLDLAAARIFVAFSVFQLLHSITFGEYRLLVTLLMYPVAVAAYLGLIMFLFRKPRRLALTVMIVHVVLWIGVQAGMELKSYLARAEAAAPPRPRETTQPPASPAPETAP